MSSGFFPSYYKHNLASKGWTNASSTSRRYLCVECNKEYNAASSLCKHFSMIHRISRNKEVSPSPPSPTKSENHSPSSSPTKPCRTESPKGNICPLCFISLGRASYARHMISKHETDPFLCTACGDRFSKYKELIDHKYTHNDSKRFRKASISEENSDSNPPRQVASITVFKCEYCPKEFTQPSHLFYHTLGHSSVFQKPIATRKYTCTVCTATFSLRRFYRCHLYKHRDALKCQSCGKQFFIMDELNKHVEEGCIRELTVSNGNDEDENITKEESEHLYLSSQDITPSSSGSGHLF